jgi:hypothetical protein
MFEGWRMRGRERQERKGGSSKSRGNGKELFKPCESPADSGKEGKHQPVRLFVLRGDGQFGRRGRKDEGA